MQRVIYLVFNILLLWRTFCISFQLEGKVHTKYNLCLNYTIYMFTVFFPIYDVICRCQGPKALAFIMSQHTRDQFLNSAVQYKSKGILLPVTKPKLAYNKETTAFVTSLCQNLLIWHSKRSAGRKQNNSSGVHKISAGA